ncbi:hypothetical protein LEN26_006068 [Aphanomyces euteiches]|nr:hypothetical protein AeMF1_002773 [Aphanomyces euteiches]KAH9136626.1 hypothetical protein LEN26_006068 [Aphanomyces euteiches]KAH9184386.1 hypothetical protein AeNC1_013642 [Aphanomyces euteiches]
MGLRYCHRNDWAYFDRLLESASPVVPISAEADLEPPVLPTPCRFEKTMTTEKLPIHRNVYWSHDDKLYAFTLCVHGSGMFGIELDSARILHG